MLIAAEKKYTRGEVEGIYSGQYESAGRFRYRGGGVPDPKYGEESSAAWIILKAGEEATVGEIRDFLPRPDLRAIRFHGFNDAISFVTEDWADDDHRGRAKQCYARSGWIEE